MPLELLKAHEENDRAVLKIFGLKHDCSNEALIAKLFSAYDEMTRGLLDSVAAKGKKR
jgi:hypothetical protein